MTPGPDGGLDLPPFFTLHAYDTVGSTNIIAKELADSGASEGQLVWARRQESGIGRRGRSWSSPEGNLYCSLMLRPECDPLTGASLSFLIAVSLHRAIESFLPAGTDIQVKWPNDILINGRKCVGILLESKTGAGGDLDYIVVGTGINIATYPELKEGLPAISLKEAGARVTVEKLLSAYAYSFLERYTVWKTEGFAPIRQDWLDRAAALGKRITVNLPDSSFEGRFSGLDETGALILELDSGESRLVTAGEVFIVP